MPLNEKGLTCLVKVGNTAVNPTTWDVLEGQTDAQFSGSVQSADTTDKSNNGWSTAIATTRSGTIQVSGNLYSVRPIFGKIEDAWQNGTTHACQIILDSHSAGWKGEFYVTDLSVTASVSDVSKYSITLTPAAALTALTPTP